MKILYFDCRNGISGDMLLSAVAELSGKKNEVYDKLESEHFHAHKHKDEGHHDNSHIHEDAHSHGRSYVEVCNLIRESNFSIKAQEYAMQIYAKIAEAEAEVHGETLETVHFHEVGRDEAIMNALGIGMAVELIAPDKIVVSEVCDGKGSIVCSHGRIPVPVPAVKAMMDKCSFTFMTADVDTEMVTPSGLGGIIGIGAQPDNGDIALITGEATAQTEAKGKRETGRPGLKAYIIEKN